MTALDIMNHEIDPTALAAVCRRYQVAELLVFGSVARGEADDKSDVDLLVSVERGAKVTLGLKPAIRGEVLAEAKTLYAA